MFCTIEEAKEAILDFSEGTVRLQIVWFWFKIISIKKDSI